MTKRSLIAAAAVAALTAAPAFADGHMAGHAHDCPEGDAPIVGLITKTATNPFFVKMAEGAAAAAEANCMELRSYAGRYDGDNETQVEAVEALIGMGAAGILITPSDSAGIVPTIEAAREAGLLVIALDTPLDPIEAADATFATDNFAAGEFIGAWAAATMGDDAANARIALLDLSTAQITVDVLRNQGFLQGFGVDVNDPDVMGDESDSRIVGSDVTQGSEEGGRNAMENLIARDDSINVVYTINEPAAAGAYEALLANGMEDDVLIVSVDGGCPGVRNIGEGVIGATSMQFPLRMASMGVEAIRAYVDSGAAPENTPGLNFFNTGVELITDQPVDGLESMTSAEGLEQCWG